MTTTASLLPHINAFLNALSGVLLLVGLVLIRRGNRAGHKTVMIGALGVSAAFLSSYLVYHFTAPIMQFPGEGWTRPVYYTIMISHILLATLVTPMVVFTAHRALTGRFDRHRAIARWTLPVWLYVAVTGIVVYYLLYHHYAPSQA